MVLTAFGVHCGGGRLVVSKQMSAKKANSNDGPKTVVVFGFSSAGVGDEHMAEEGEVLVVVVSVVGAVIVVEGAREVRLRERSLDRSLSM